MIFSGTAKAMIPKIPVRKIIGRTRILEIENPLIRLFIFFALYTLCHDAWLNISAAVTAIINVSANSIPVVDLNENSSGEISFTRLMESVMSPIQKPAMITISKSGRIAKN